MNAPGSLLMVPFREVRHFQPDDCLHYEPIGIRGKLHHWTIPVHRHEELHQFELLERGAVVATIDGIRYELTAPAAWMVAPGVMHGFAYEPDSAGHKVTMPTALLRSIPAPASRPGRLGRPIVLRKSDIGADAGELRELFAQLAREFQGRRSGRAEALHAHAILLGLWFMRHEGAASAIAPRQALADTLVQRFRSLVESHFREHWPVRDYAAALGVTPDHLSRCCRAVTGLGALDLMHERLVLEARRLLAYTPAAVHEIAHQLGFDDPGYFSRLFTKRAGQSPSAYRVAIAEGLGVLPAPSSEPATCKDRAPLHNAGKRQRA
jgi:AraC family transcriptional regulator, transcriptional activator of pobA